MSGRREAARERWDRMSDSQRAERVRRMQAGRRRAMSPERLNEIEAQMERLNDEFKSLPRGDKRRAEIMRELRPLGDRRVALVEHLSQNQREEAT